MLKWLVTYAVRTYVSGPARSWIFTAAAMGLMRLARKTTSRTELVDITPIKPGQMIIVEHLDISHKRQMKQLKKQRKSGRKSRRRAGRPTAAADTIGEG